MGAPLPTNEWYLNLVVGLHDDPGQNGRYDNFAGEENRVHTIPYIVDTVGPIVGIRLHYPNVLSYGTVVQSAFVPQHGLTLGTADGSFTRRYEVDEGTLPSKLGVGLRWVPSETEERRRMEGSDTRRRFMRSSILRGMPYGTVEYYGGDVSPTIASEVAAEAPVVDGSARMECGELDPRGGDAVEPAGSGSGGGGGGGVLVEEDVELRFPESDFTWLVFFSRPVRVRCYVNPAKAVGSASLPPGAASAEDNPSAFQLRVDSKSDGGVDGDGDDDEEPLVVRIALANNCTAGTNVHFCDRSRPRDQSSFASVLRDGASVYPTSPAVKYAFSDPEGGLSPTTPDSKSAYLFFDWRARAFGGGGGDPRRELITFALPHHMDIMRRLDGQSSNEVLREHCVHSLHGNTCLVRGGLWAMEEGESTRVFLRCALVLFVTAHLKRNCFANVACRARRFAQLHVAEAPGAFRHTRSCRVALEGYSVQLA